MKRISLVIAVLALLSGLSSCRKPDTSSWSSYHKHPITFSNAVSDNQKTLVDGGSSLYYKWESDDKIRVYTTTEDDDFSNGHYCGDLKLTKGAGDKVATFHNPGVYIPAGDKKIRFIYVGKDISVNDGGTDEVDFSNQNGGISSVSDKLIAIYDTGINETGVYENGKLEMQFSVIKFSFADFGDGDVYVKGMQSNRMKVEKNGKITYNTAKTNTRLETPSFDFYAVFMPQGSTTYNFANAEGFANRTYTIDVNKFYNINDSEGNPIVITSEKTPAASPTVTTSMGCIGNGIFNYGGEVNPTVPQTCEFGIVYSTGNMEPTVGGSGCVNEAAANAEPLSSAKSFNIDVAQLDIDDSQTIYARAYAIGENLMPVYGEIKIIDPEKEGIAKSHPELWKNGENPFPFTVGSGKVVHFSQGNLQWSAEGTHYVYDYLGRTVTRLGTWRFANHQFDIIGDNNSNISSTYKGWIDLFGWATAGYMPDNPDEHEQIRRQPFRYDNDDADYGNGESDFDYNLDWGRYNDISNDGYGVGAWHTLSEAEFKYLYETRKNAGKLRGFATIGGCTHGLVILPDDWNLTESPIISTLSGWTDNQYNHSQWAVMEGKGAVFLPAAGARDETVPSGFNFWGCYWSCNHIGSVYAMSYDFSPSHDSRLYSTNVARHSGRAVRVVRDVSSK
ncbi:MAG: hypothetical protein Q4F69_05965 [Bacteroidia bacterium]|nr:hypothetical protein [Bacteroidia bacterium]